MINQSLIEGLNHFSPVYQGEDNDLFVEPHFSWFRAGCDGCGPCLGGNCYDVKCRDANDDIIEISVCEDCFVELCQ